MALDVSKLPDLAPHWIGLPNMADGVKFYIGVSFLCPHCDHSVCPTCGAARGKRLAVSFWPPIDPDGWEPRIIAIPHAHFHRRIGGDTFETLTLEPSVGLDPHWHGRITNGRLTR
jgi:hypothetical protein